MIKTKTSADKEMKKVFQVNLGEGWNFKASVLFGLSPSSGASTVSLQEEVVDQP